MRGEHKLRAGELRQQHAGDLPAVAGVDGHQDVVQGGEAEFFALESAHQGEEEAQAHAVLVSLAVEGARREEALAVEVDVERQLAGARRQPRLEGALVVAVDAAVERLEVAPHPVVDLLQPAVGARDEDVQHPPGGRGTGSRGLAPGDGVPQVAEPFTRGREPGHGGHGPRGLGERADRVEEAPEDRGGAAGLGRLRQRAGGGLDGQQLAQGLGGALGGLAPQPHCLRVGLAQERSHVAVAPAQRVDLGVERRGDGGDGVRGPRAQPRRLGDARGPLRQRRRKDVRRHRGAACGTCLAVVDLRGDPEEVVARRRA